MHQQNKPALQHIMSLVEAGQLQKAREICSDICNKNKKDIEPMIIMAMIHDRMGNPGKMEKRLRKALKINPNLGIAYHNLGRALAMQEKYEEAAEAFKRAQQTNPSILDPYLLLAEVYSKLNRVPQAIEQLTCALRINASRADIYYKLGLLHYKKGNIDKAIEMLDKALSLKQDYTEPYYLLHYIHYEEGKYEDAKSCYEKLLDIARDDGAKIRHATMAPIIMESEEEIANFRESLMQRIDSLLHDKLVVNNPVDEIRYTNFQLAYHGHNDKALQVKLAKLYIHACPGLTYESPNLHPPLKERPNRKIKIGLISNCLGSHSIGKAARGLISKLSRDRFHVTAFFLEKPEDRIGNLIRDTADRSVVLGNSLGKARQGVERENIDILFYQDIGMEPVTYFLAFSRLAPVQCTYFGHPVTTGIPNMDYFISTDSYEPPDMEEHYSEKLVLLKGVAAPSYCYKPEIPPLDISRDRFGFGEHEHIYFSPQTLYKFHPAIDDVIANILRSDPLGRIVLKVGRRPYLAELLKKRFSKSMPDVASRITFIPQLSQQDYFSMIALSDVMLDTTHFGGFTTTIDAIAVGTPVITWPGEFMRGRHTMSFYNKMGIKDCIADTLEDYAGKALKLATDPDYNQHVRQKILDAGDAIWKEEKVIAEYERIFEEMLTLSGNL